MKTKSSTTMLSLGSKWIKPISIFRFNIQAIEIVPNYSTEVWKWLRITFITTYSIVVHGLWDYVKEKVVVVVVAVILNWITEHNEPQKFSHSMNITAYKKPFFQPLRKWEKRGYIPFLQRFGRYHLLPCEHIKCRKLKL